MADSLLVLLIVLAAAAYLSVRVLRAVQAARAARDGECAGGCCSGTAAPKKHFWNRRAA